MEYTNPKIIKDLVILKFMIFRKICKFKLNIFLPVGPITEQVANNGPHEFEPEADGVAANVPRT